MTAFEMPPAKTQSAAPVKPVDMAAVARAAAILEAGGLVAMPTETVYGLAADADQETAVTATYRAKGRPLNHPLIVHVASADDIPWWAEMTPEAQKLADRYWPGPLTMRRLGNRWSRHCGAAMPVSPLGARAACGLRRSEAPRSHGAFGQFVRPHQPVDSSACT